jgi:hypothetical protein
MLENYLSCDTHGPFNSSALAGELPKATTKGGEGHHGEDSNQ